MPVLTKKPQKALAPARTLALGFFVIIAAGALLLCLPFSSKSGTFTSFSDCIFTAASATCVTGMSILDTYTHWSVFGQTVIMLLQQVGGLGFITLVTFFNLAAGKKLSFSQAANASGGLTMNGLSSTGKIFTRVVIFSLVIETAAAALYMVRFVPRYGGYGVFMSFFTAISAFCNAGFDLFGIEGAGAGMTVFADDPYILIITAALTILGGFGFVVLEDLLAYRKNKRLGFHTRVVLITSAVLIAFGTIIYFIIELVEAEAFGDYTMGQRFLTAFFGSVCSRSSGFTAAPLPTVSSFSKMFTILLAFIGAAPGSTGGGIKVTTLAIIMATAWSVLKGRDDTQMLKHSVSKQVVYKTLTILCLSLIFIITGFFVVHLLNTDYDSADVLYEVIACFSTAGFSSGLSAASGTATRLILAFIMFVGRIGPVSLMLSFTGGGAKNKNEILPHGEIMVG